jgi:hypothetical protein
VAEYTSQWMALFMPGQSAPAERTPIFVFICSLQRNFQILLPCHKSLS